MILTIGNIKGGVGKSTIACNVAAMLSTNSPAPLVLIDGDKQGSAAEFTAQREENHKGGAGFVCARAQGAEVRAQAKGLAAAGHTVVIDAGGQDNPALRAALTISDMVLIPIPPKSFEAWALDAMSDLVKEVRETVNPDLKALAFVNMGFPTGGDNQFIQAMINEDYPELALLPRMICQRKAFSDAAGLGLSVTEKKPIDIKAVEEFLSVMEAAGLYKDNIISMER